MSPAGARRHRLVKVKGLAELQPDLDGTWTTRITRKYVAGPEGEVLARRRSSMARILSVLRPAHPIAFGLHA